MAALCLLVSICLLSTACGQQSPDNNMSDQELVNFLNNMGKGVGGGSPSVNTFNTGPPTPLPPGSPSVNTFNTQECPCNCGSDQGTAGEGLIKYRFPGNCPTSSPLCCNSATPAPAGGRQFNQQNPLTTISPINTFPSGSTPQYLGCGTTQQGIVMFRANFADEDGDTVETLEEEFPWTVAVYRNSKFLCGGSLIHPRAVLAAAHSFRRVKTRELSIRAGEHDRVKHNQMFEYQESTVSEIVKHEGYDQALKANDAAILFLHKDIMAAGNVAYACLPPPSLQPALGDVCIATGWGASRVGGLLQARKKMVELPVVDHYTCEAAIKATPRISSSYQLPDSMLCAGGQGGTDVCTGDGGAPLVCAYAGEAERYYQAGIASWGIGCGLVDKPGVFTAVHRVRDWIDRTMAARSFDSSYYTPPTP